MPFIKTNIRLVRLWFPRRQGKRKLVDSVGNRTWKLAKQGTIAHENGYRQKNIEVGNAKYEKMGCLLRRQKNIAVSNIRQKKMSSQKGKAVGNAEHEHSVGKRAKYLPSPSIMSFNPLHLILTLFGLLHQPNLV